MDRDSHGSNEAEHTECNPESIKKCAVARIFRGVLDQYYNRDVTAFRNAVDVFCEDYAEYCRYTAQHVEHSESLATGHTRPVSGSDPTPTPAS